MTKTIKNIMIISNEILEKIKYFLGFYNLDQFLNDESGKTYTDGFVNMSNDDIKKHLCKINKL